MVKITRFPGIFVCLLLVISVLSNLSVVGSEDDYELFFEDPQEYPDLPDMDLKSLSSWQVSDFVVIELRTYGSISDEPEYYYSITSPYSDYDDWFDFYYSEGYGNFYYCSETESISLDHTWDIIDDALIVRVPLKYVGQPEDFNLTASSFYEPQDKIADFEMDFINEPDSYMGSSYDFDDHKPMDIPGSVNGHLEEDDHNIYSFEMAPDSGISIEMTVSFGSWPYFTVYNAEKHYVTSSMSSGRKSEMTFVPKASGTYYLVVDGWSVNGRYKITTSLRGLSGEGYQREIPDEIPWKIGDSWTAGCYFGTDEILDMFFAGYEDLIYGDKPEYSTEGGLAHFINVTYIGEQKGEYRFEYNSRLYCDIILNMTMQTPAYCSDEYDSNSQEYTNISGIVDIIYHGSIWLGYYENEEGDSYFGIEKQTILLNGSLDISTEMSFSDCWSDTEDYFTFKTRSWGTIDLDLTLENSPGIPYLPSKDETLEVDKKVSTDLTGYSNIDIKMTFDSSDNDFTDFYDDDMDYTYNDEFNESYTWYYILSYDPETKIAETVPALTDPFSYLMIPMYRSYGYIEDEVIDDIHHDWLNYWHSKSVYDPESGFYSAFELPLSPFGNTAVPLDATVDESMIDPIQMFGANLMIEGVSRNKAAIFFDDPAGFIDDEKTAESVGNNLPAEFIVIPAALLFIISMTILLVYLQRKAERQ